MRSFERKAFEEEDTREDVLRLPLVSLEELNKKQKEKLKAGVEAAAKIEAKAAKRRAINHRYNHSEKGKARSARHEATDKKRASRSRYNKSEKGHLSSYFYDTSMKGTERRAWAVERKRHGGGETY